jgi:hypothetical protein
MKKVSAVEVGSWVAMALKFLGLAAEIAAETAPLYTKNEKTQADITKAAAAGKAAGALADAAAAVVAEKSK